jgi:3-deoxy-D-manno-octulosonic-acid transferase
MCSHIFVQDAASEQLLRQIGIQNTSVVGDTRFDRVIAASEKTQSLDIVVDFIKKPNILVAGSTWWPDETMLQALSQQLDESWQMIIVPHEVDRQHIDKLSELFGKEATTYSNYSLKGPYSKILVVDTIRKLIHIYRYATVVWVGGGFGKAGIHNVLEPAVFAKPCFFGPIYHQFIEANALIAANGAKEMHDFGQFYNFLSQSYAQSALEEMGKNAHAYVVSNGGATSHIMAYLAAKLDN